MKCNTNASSACQQCVQLPLHHASGSISISFPCSRLHQKPSHVAAAANYSNSSSLQEVATGRGTITIAACITSSLNQQRNHAATLYSRGEHSATAAVRLPTATVRPARPDSHWGFFCMGGAPALVQLWAVGTFYSLGRCLSPLELYVKSATLVRNSFIISTCSTSFVLPHLLPADNAMLLQARQQTTACACCWELRM